MIATLDEFRQAKSILEDEKQKLVSKGEKVGEKIEVGIMVEIPSTAVLADQFAKEVDFFSINCACEQHIQKLIDLEIKNEGQRI